MDEIRTRVRLVNAFDEIQARRQEIAFDAVRFCEMEAVVDANANHSTIPGDLLSRLGVNVRGRQAVQHADGRMEIVSVTGPVLFEILRRDTLDDALVVGDQVVIGRTVLAKLDLLVDPANHRLIPNPAHPDQPVSKVK